MRFYVDFRFYVYSPSMCLIFFACSPIKNYCLQSILKLNKYSEKFHKNSEDEKIIKKNSSKVEIYNFMDLIILCHKICYKAKLVFVQRVLRKMMKTRT